MKKKGLEVITLCVGLFTLGMGSANATGDTPKPGPGDWYAKGKVLCDVNQSGSIDAADRPLGDFGYPDVVVNAVNSSGGVFSTTTDATGHFHISLPDVEDSYTETLDASTLPGDAMIVHPPGGQYNFTLTNAAPSFRGNWLIDSAACRAVAKCWMTGGGVKFSSVTGTNVAEANGRGPEHSMGGNVFPSCDPDPGDGGQWNHIAHADKLHFLGTVINTVNCGNVPGIEPGSESPVTPYNFIEYQGTGRLTGIKGNKVDHGTVHFFARVEDRNEPGSNGAKAGVDIDRYYIHVFSDPADPDGTTLMLVDEDGNSSTVDPVTITGGNLQLHISSCDNPPAW